MIDSKLHLGSTSLRRLAIVSAAASLGFNAMPVLNGYLTQHLALSGDVVAQVSEIQLIGFGLTVISSPAWIYRVDTRAIMFTGLLLLFILPIMLVTGGFADRGWLLLLAGSGSGLANAAVFYCAASHHQPAKSYGTIFAYQMGIAFVFVVVLSSPSIRALGMLSPCIAFSAVYAFAMWVVLQGRPRFSAFIPVVQINCGQVYRIVLLLGAMILFLAGIVSIWAFLDVLETGRHVSDPSRFPLWTATSLAASACGSVVATRAVTRNSSVIMMLLAGVLALTGCLGLIEQIGLVALACIVALSFGWNVGLTLSTAEIAYSDPSGRAVPLALATVGLGGGVGLITLGAPDGGTGDVTFLRGCALFITIGAVALTWLVRWRPTQNRMTPSTSRTTTSDPVSGEPKPRQ